MHVETTYGPINRVISVYAHTTQDMQCFLQQHGFDPMLSNVRYVPNPDCSEMVNVIQPYRLRSNVYQKTYTVMTTQQLIDFAYTNVGSHLSDACMFGSAVFRDDIEVVNLVQQLIDELPFVGILDFTLIDGDYSASSDLSWETIKRCRLFDEDAAPDFEQLDSSYHRSICAIVCRNDDIFGNMKGDMLWQKSK